jgi:hypothetical protein
LHATHAWIVIHLLLRALAPASFMQNPLPSTAGRDNFSEQSWATEFFAQ